MAEITGNRVVEDASIEWVIQHEKAAGRNAENVRGKGHAGDISSPPRTIEVKAYGGSARGHDLWLEVRQFEAAKSDPEFYIYVVDNIRQGDPEHFHLVVLGGDRLKALLVRAKPQRYVTVPWPVADYESSPPLLP